MIPKIIWQTYNSKYDDLPNSLKLSTETWIKLNPTWKYNYFDNEEREYFVKNESLELYKIYKNVKPQLQADIWRYLITYKNGGVYADIDSICIMPLDYMLKTYKNEELIVTEPSTGGRKGTPTSINNANFAIIPKSKIMFDVITKYINDPCNIDDYWTSIRCWNDVIKINLDKISTSFISAMHTQELYYEFPENLYINYYGKKINYKDYLDLDI